MPVSFGIPSLPRDLGFSEVINIILRGLIAELLLIIKDSRIYQYARLQYMKIISWNVNGLRAIARKGNFKELLDLDADILCLQETKCEPSQLDEVVKSPSQYPYTYFSYSHKRRGYSGVAMYSKILPNRVEYVIPGQESVNTGLFDEKMDEEGRIIIAHFEKFVLITCYFPNGGGGPERLEYKLKFYDDFLKYVKRLDVGGKQIIFCGDINTAHNEIDLARPKENETSTGFLPIERAWLDKVIKNNFIDVFRHFHRDEVGAYTWWDMKTSSRDRNIGWRLDYFFANQTILEKVRSIRHLTDFMGSDHCPVMMEIDL